MKTLYRVLFLLLIFNNCRTVDHSGCDLKLKVFNEIFLNEEIKKHIHSEIKDRLPYAVIFNDSECNLKNELFYYITDNDGIIPEYFIKIFDYNVVGNKVNVSFFYNLEGININCELYRDNSGEVKVINVDFIEI